MLFQITQPSQDVVLSKEKIKGVRWNGKGGTKDVYRSRKILYGALAGKIFVAAGYVVSMVIALATTCEISRKSNTVYTICPAAILQA